VVIKEELFITINTKGEVMDIEEEKETCLGGL